MGTSSLLLNGIKLNVLSEAFMVASRELASPEQLSLLREELEPEWFLYSRGGTAYGVQTTDSMAKPFENPRRADVRDHKHLIAALTLAHIRGLLAATGSRVLNKKPFVYSVDAKEIVASVLSKTLGNTPAVLKSFKIRRKYELNAKIIEPRSGESFIALVMNLGTKWDIEASLRELSRSGVNAVGLFAVERSDEKNLGRLLGRIASIDNGVALLEDTITGSPIYRSTDELGVENSRKSFKKCLQDLLGDAYERFEASRQVEQAEFTTPAAFNDWVERLRLRLFEKHPVMRPGGGLQIAIGERIRIGNNPQYKSVTEARPIEYCFDRARTKRSKFAWNGMEDYGPFAPVGTRSPKILLLCPNVLQGPAENFVRLLRSGVSTVSDSKFRLGLDRTLELANPRVTIYPFPWLDDKMAESWRKYTDAVDNALAVESSTGRPDIAIVVVPESQRQLPDEVNPYLHAKARLLTAGIPVQSVRDVTLRQNVEKLQYTFQNFTAAMCAKLSGIPWTVDSDHTLDDEIVIGLGSCELSGSRLRDRQRYVGITTVFRGDGSYVLSHLADVCSFGDYPQRLRESMTHILSVLKHRNGWRHGDRVRIVFHSFKPLREEEIGDIIADAVSAVANEQRVSFAFVTVSHDHEFVLLDPQQAGRNAGKRGTIGRLAPERGVIVEIGPNTRLVCTKGPTLIKRSGEPPPRPILVSLHSASTYGDRQYLAEQVLRFSALSWKSVLPSSEPVTILYSELIAREIVRLQRLPGWSNAALNDGLATSRWFL